MNFSEKGLQFLKNEEGCVLHRYLDSAGKPTIGVGHLLTETEKHTGIINIKGKKVIFIPSITNQQALDLLNQDVTPAEKCVNDNVKVELNQNQFDTLVSFTFNCGQAAFKGSTLLKRINSGKFNEVPVELNKWIHSDGKVDDVLVQRRKRECKLWKGEL